ncbi:MAG: transcriptional repressor [Planctomycetota bacterium]|nr:MAG: transcriptional repressor [Planctomycetota bacterium]
MEKMEKLKRLQEVCQEKGLRLTVQKRMILENMLSRHDHPTADQVFQEVQKKIPGISRATVYRILDNLVEEGLILKISHPDSSGRYDGNTDRHHHLICSHCHQVEDIFIPPEQEPDLSHLVQNNMKVKNYTIYFEGLCPNCKNIHN